MSPMRILHVIPAVAARYGGPSTAIWPMTHALRQLPDFHVEIATTDADGKDGQLSLDQLPTTAGPIHLFPRLRGEHLKFAPDLGRWIGENASRFDVIQVHSNWNYPTTVACRAARKAGVPYVIRPCGMMSDYTRSRSQWKKRFYWWTYERSNLQNAAAIHATSLEEKQEVERLGVNGTVQVIPLGIAEDAWDVPVEKDWLRRACPRAGNRAIVLFLSRIHPKKGLADLLLPAMARLSSNAFLAVVGAEDDRAPGALRNVQEQIRKLGLEDRVALLGPLPPAGRWAAFDGADVFVLPSHSENFGIVVAEAMARSKPVIVTTGVQFAEHIRASGAGEVVEPNVSELATAIEGWLCDPARSARAGEAGRSYIRSNFTWQRTAEKMAALYQTIRANHWGGRNGRP